MGFRTQCYSLATDWDRLHKEMRCRIPHGSSSWDPELKCHRGVDWVPMPERDCSATLIRLTPGYRQVVVVPDTVMCRKYVEWFTAWKAEYTHCAHLVYDIEILPWDDWLMTATIPIVKHLIFDEGHPPVLQEILPVSQVAESSQPVKCNTVLRWGPSRVPYSGITPVAAFQSDGKKRAYDEIVAD